MAKGRWVRAVCFTFIIFFSLNSVLSGEEKSMTPLGEKNIPMIEGIKMLEVGVEAPSFAIKDLKGSPYNFSPNLGEKQFLLVFWSIFCEPCRYEMPLIQTIYKKYGPKGLEVLAIAIDGEPLKNAIAGFVRQEGYSFTVLIDELDEDEYFKVADPYGVAGTPTVYIVDRKGKISYVKAGGVSEKELEKAVDNVIQK